MTKLNLAIPFDVRYRFARTMNNTAELSQLQAESAERFEAARAEYERERAEAESEAKRQEAERQAANARQYALERGERLRRAGVTLRDETSDLCVQGRLSATEAVKTAGAWWDARPTPWLVLGGLTGSGKTVAAAGLIADTGGVWMRADDVVRAFSGMFGDPLEKQERAKAAYLLVIDDLGSELDPARMLPALLELIDTRISARGRPTVCTTNLTPKEFAGRYANDRLNSRMRELVTWKTLSTTDLRRPIRLVSK